MRRPAPALPRLLDFASALAGKPLQLCASARTY